jgi:alpha-D-ribose 1-methylphosphonate 5-triphosphate synthase subunit PhnH
VTWDAVHDSRRAFLCCMRAQCAPGSAVGPLPLPGLMTDPRLDAAAAVLLTLLDSTTPVAACGTEARDVVAVVSAVTGSPVTDVPDAEFVLVVGDPADAISRAPRGDRDRPEAGATVVAVVDGAQEALTLAGPGIPSRRSSMLGLSVEARRERDRANAGLPCGVDLLLVGDDGVLALPRTVEIVEGVD